MTVFWVVLLFAGVIDSMQSDADKLARWHARDAGYLTYDRMSTVLVMILAVWQLYVLWVAN